MFSISRALVARKFALEEGFRWRGEDITRIESLSDAVFALAVTLLIVSTEVPHTYRELLDSLRNFLPFAVCFIQIMIVWYQHYLYCRRYNLQDYWSTVLSMSLLFVVLLYTYPLKFLFTVLFNSHGREAASIGSYADFSDLMTIYALGYLSVFAIFFAMYIRIWRRRDALELTEIECWDTKHSIREFAIQIGVGLLSLTLARALDGELIGLSGICYGLLGPLMALHGYWSGKRRRLLSAKYCVLSAE